MARVKIVWDSNLEQKINDDPDAMRYMALVAAAAESHAKAAAPVGPGPEHYVDGLEGQVVHTAKGWQAVLVSNDWKSHWVEFGSAHNPAHHPVKRGMEAAGVKVLGS